MFNQILVVCTGNICRSPMAAGLLAAELGSNHSVRSAGTGALVGYPADDHAVEVMRQHGYDVSDHRAQFLSEDLLRWADLILVMDLHHRNRVQEIDPTARGKTFLLGHWQGDQPIADPVGEDLPAFERAYREIEQAVQTWIAKLAH